MKTSCSRFLLSSVLLASVLVAVPARAVTISSVLNVSNHNPFTGTGPYPFTDDGTPLGSLDFTGQPVGSMPTLSSVNFSLSLANLDTSPVDIDFNNISLTIAGYDTGLKLNGFTNGFFAETHSFNANIINGALILAAIQNTPGAIAVGLLDATPTHSNKYYTYGGSFAMTLDSQPVPFSPTQSLGLFLTAGIAGFARWRRSRAAALVAA
jgi:hypothetical protein